MAQTVEATGSAGRYSSSAPSNPHIQQRLTFTQGLYQAVDVPDKLVNGRAVGGHGLPVGVGDAVLTWSAGCVPRQRVDLVRETAIALLEVFRMPRAQREHEVGLPEYRLA